MTKIAVLTLIFSFSTSSWATTLTSINDNEICKNTVEGTSLSQNEQQIVRLFKHWIDKETDFEKIEEFVSRLNSSEYPFNPFGQIFSPSEAQLSSLIEKILPLINPKNWNSILQLINGHLENSHQRIKDIVNIDTREKITIERTHLLNTAPLTTPEPNSSQIHRPSLVNANNTTYVFEIQNKSRISEIYIHSFHSDRKQSNTIIEVDPSGFFPNGKDDNLILESTTFLSDPSLINDTEVIVNATITFLERDLNKYLNVNALIKINLIDGKTGFLFTFSKNLLDRPEKKYFVSNKNDIYFTDIKGIDDDQTVTTLNHLDPASGKIEKIMTLENSLSTTPQFFLDSEGNLHWILVSDNNEMSIYTKYHNTQQFYRVPVSYKLDGLDDVKIFVVYQYSESEILISTKNKNTSYLFIYDTLKKDVRPFTEFNSEYQTGISEIFFKGINDNLFLLTAISRSKPQKLAIAEVDIDNNRLITPENQLVISSNPSMSFGMYQGLKDRHFFYLVSGNSQIKTFEFIQDENRLIEIDHIELAADSKLGTVKLSQDGSQFLLPEFTKNGQLNIYSILRKR